MCVTHGIPRAARARCLQLRPALDAYVNRSIISCFFFPPTVVTTVTDPTLTPCSDRLPTVSAAQALEDLDANVSRFVSTNLPDLDKALAASAASSSPSEEANAGGIQKGHLTEIWGPPGVGKTAFGIQAAADVLRGGHRVVWVGQ